MLVCPQCRFENPNTNKFCQECGTSLTQNTCPSCNSLVPFDALHCQVCGELAGVVWWAIVTGEADRSRVNKAEIPPVYAVAQLCDEAAAGETPTVCYLDLQKRYRLLDSPPTNEELTAEHPIRVLDCQPLQLSPLEALGQSIEFPDPNSRGGYANAGESEAAERGAALGVSSSVQALLVPMTAQPYLALRDRFYQTLPLIHDAWQRDGYQVVLLEDRSHFPLLLDLWINEEQILPPLQILHWLYEMVELWSALEPWSCCQSLLEITNLRVDEDHSLCLQRLYADSTDAPLTLQELGHLWQTLFAQSQRTQFGALATLLADLDNQVLTTVEDLQARIEAIAYELQAHAVAVAAEEDLLTPPITKPPVEGAAMPFSAAMDVQAASPEETGDRVIIPRKAMKGRLEEEGEGDNDPTVVLPMQLFNLEDVGRTDIGRQRHHNEDYFGIESQVTKLESPSGKTVHVRNLYILCDGMGGQADGEIASALAVDTLRRYFREQWQNSSLADLQTSPLPGPDVLNDAIQQANKAIYDVNQQNARSGSGRMGTTLVMLLIHDTEVAIAHVGDSRLYRYTRKRGLEQLTTDHEVGQREIQRGVDPDIAYARPDAYQLTQALGPRDEHFVKPDIQYLELNEDTLLFLCSDGLTDNNLLETHWKTHIEPMLSSQTNLEQGVSQLIELANQYNGHDNISAIAIRAKVRPNLAHLR